MDMFRHDHIGPKEKALTLAGKVKGIDEPLPGSILAKQRESPKAGKGKLMCIAGNVVGLVTLSVGGSHV